MRPRHRVSHYRKRKSASTPFQEETFEWVLLRREIRCTVQGLEGGVTPGEMGPTPNSTHWLKGSTGWDLRQGDGLRIDAGTMEGWTFTVENSTDWGRVGGVQATLVHADEDFEE